jgi:indole-3-glycerol phosphate synthase
LRDHRIHAALIGEHFMRQVHPGEAVTDILIR